MFPRLVAAEHRTDFHGRWSPSGVPELDKLLGGGITAGSSTLIDRSGGHRKIAADFQYLSPRRDHPRRARPRCSSSTRSLGCCSHGRQSAWTSTSRRCADAGKLFIEQVDAAEVSPGEFSHRVRTSASIARTSAPW